MAVHASYNRNAHLVYWDTHRKRILDVIGPNVIKYVLSANELNASATDPDGWTTTVVEVGAGTSEFNPSDAIDFIGDLVTAANENDGINTQRLGEEFQFDSSHHIYMMCKMKINDVTQSDFVIGLCITDTTLLGGMTDGVYFESLDGSTDVDIVAEKDSTETTGGSPGTLVDATVHTLEFYWDGTTLEAFVDGASIYNAAPANIPDDEELRPSIHFLTGEAVAQTMSIQDFRVYQWGRA